ncbi:nucleoside ABC transporter ATP-binding protein [Aliiruegeria haliotis]|uniref:Nucleoside ABC transporter ATP-binding protein n=1 Tax=Aliiruegeria haliotis TaxID=1280846 RepID=A0A2T0RYQ0_9RHOB|nr:ABC transporter ATP-binding protein [Aliiruegeria haliotis]PRY26316.1 nucleoside ABC transporter ATP-binding protein [Aliiruegeria haliotis]
MTRTLTTEAGAISVEALHMTMRFGEFTALDDVSINIQAGSFHALLGENGAGKSTLVKCIMGFYHATAGELLVAGREAFMTDPKIAQSLGLGMVYQHFTLVPSLTAAENLVISRADAPGVINWRREREKLAQFMATMPFSVPLDLPVSRLAAGEKQKLEILKQLYLGNRFLILDEPTSVLTPAEADEVLGHVRALTRAGEITVLMITHKFREVTAFADEVSILRRGRYVGGGKVGEMSVEEMSRAMMGTAPEVSKRPRAATNGREIMRLSGVEAQDRTGLKTIRIDEISLKSGEILGVAGISGNGQMELMEVLTGQRRMTGGEITVNGQPFAATRAEARAHKLRYLPEEPLRNACAPRMSVAENLAFRTFDTGGNGRTRFWKDDRAIARNASTLIEDFKVKTSSPAARIASLSGGNVQRAVLGRELTGEVDALIVSNPCFGLDFAAVSSIRDRLVEARNNGTAILLISEDLDEIMELSDRILVMSEGRVAFETPIASADVSEIGQHMAGHG